RPETPASVDILPNSGLEKKKDKKSDGDALKLSCTEDLRLVIREKILPKKSKKNVSDENIKVILSESNKKCNSFQKIINSKSLTEVEFAKKKKDKSKTYSSKPNKLDDSPATKDETSLQLPKQKKLRGRKRRDDEDNESEWENQLSSGKMETSACSIGVHSSSFDLPDTMYESMYDKIKRRASKDIGRKDGDLARPALSERLTLKKPKVKLHSGKKELSSADSDTDECFSDEGNRHQHLKKSKQQSRKKSSGSGGGQRLLQRPCIDSDSDSTDAEANASPKLKTLSRTGNCKQKKAPKLAKSKNQNVKRDRIEPKSDESNSSGEELIVKNGSQKKINTKRLVSPVNISRKNSTKLGSEGKQIPNKNKINLELKDTQTSVQLSIARKKHKCNMMEDKKPRKPRAEKDRQHQSLLHRVFASTDSDTPSSMTASSLSHSSDEAQAEPPQQVFYHTDSIKKSKRSKHKLSQNLQKPVKQSPCIRSHCKSASSKNLKLSSIAGSSDSDSSTPRISRSCSPDEISGVSSNAAPSCTGSVISETNKIDVACKPICRKKASPRPEIASTLDSPFVSISSSTSHTLSGSHDSHTSVALSSRSNTSSSDHYGSGGLTDDNSKRTASTLLMTDSSSCGDLLDAAKAMKLERGDWNIFAALAGHQSTPKPSDDLGNTLTDLSQPHISPEASVGHDTIGVCAVPLGKDCLDVDDELPSLEKHEEEEDGELESPDQKPLLGDDSLSLNESGTLMMRRHSEFKGLSNYEEDDLPPPVVSAIDSNSGESVSSTQAVCTVCTSEVIKDVVYDSCLPLNPTITATELPDTEPIETSKRCQLDISTASSGFTSRDSSDSDSPSEALDRFCTTEKSDEVKLSTFESVSIAQSTTESLPSQQVFFAQEVSYSPSLPSSSTVGITLAATDPESDQASIGQTLPNSQGSLVADATTKPNICLGSADLSGGALLSTNSTTVDATVLLTSSTHLMNLSPAQPQHPQQVSLLQAEIATNSSKTLKDEERPVQSVNQQAISQKPHQQRIALLMTTAPQVTSAGITSSVVATRTTVNALLSTPFVITTAPITQRQGVTSTVVCPPITMSSLPSVHPNPSQKTSTKLSEQRVTTLVTSIVNTPLMTVNTTSTQRKPQQSPSQQLAGRSPNPAPSAPLVVINHQSTSLPITSTSPISVSASIVSTTLNGQQIPPSSGPVAPVRIHSQHYPLPPPQPPNGPASTSDLTTYVKRVIERVKQEKDEEILKHQRTGGAHSNSSDRVKRSRRCPPQTAPIGHSAQATSINTPATSMIPTPIAPMPSIPGVNLCNKPAGSPTLPAAALSPKLPAVQTSQSGPTRRRSAGASAAAGDTSTLPTGGDPYEPNFDDDSVAAARTLATPESSKTTPLSVSPAGPTPSTIGTLAPTRDSIEEIIDAVSRGHFDEEEYIQKLIGGQFTAGLGGFNSLACISSTSVNLSATSDSPTTSASTSSQGSMGTVSAGHHSGTRQIAITSSDTPVTTSIASPISSVSI
ncbi:unnamed protein product, partial [Protopolystoma xenopodis]